MLYRLAGILLISSSLAGFIGQAVALRMWDGYYLFTGHLISDLGMTRCDQIRDIFGPRYICSPGHDWFTYGTIISGVLLSMGAILLWVAGIRASPRDTVAGYRSVGILLVLSGAGVTAVGFYPLDVDVVAHGIGVIVHAVATWLAIIVAIRATAAAPPQGFIPMLHGANRGLTTIMLVVSMLGFAGLILLGTSDVIPGFFERLSFDMLSVWVFLLGVALWKVPSFRRTERNKRRRRNELDARKQERDDAVRKAVEDFESNQSNRSDQA